MDIKIFVSCHKKFFVPKNKLLVPVQVGTAFTDERYEGFCYDNEGDNIAEKNKSYCELTTQYWAWKNVQADYYGFFHYRRYMNFTENTLGRDDVVTQYFRCDEDMIEETGLNEELMEQIISENDIVTLKPRIYENGETVRSLYAKEKVHFIEDLDECCLDVVRELYPEVFEHSVNYINGHTCYYCNMFIAKKEIFDEYCQFLFDVLEEYEKRRDVTDYTVAQYRIYGYLGERLWGIYYTYLRNTRDLRCRELQRVDVKFNDPVELQHAFGKNNIPIVIASSDYYTPYASVLLKSVAENSTKEHNYDVIVFNLGLNEHNKGLFRQTLAAYDNFSVRFVDLSPVTAKYKQYTLSGKGYVSMHSWLRIFTPYVLKDYDKIIYLDSDMIVHHDVAELFAYDVSDSYLAATRDLRVIACGYYIPRRQKYVEDEVKLQNRNDYFQAGVIVMNLNRFRERFTIEELLTICTSKTWELLDQDMLNSILNNEITYIDQRWDVVADWNDRCKPWIDSLPHEMNVEFNKAYADPWIVHYGGPYKPWSNPDIDFYQLFWHYARNSLVYEYILMRSIVEKTRNAGSAPAKGKPAAPARIDGTTGNENKFLNKLFPRDSRRRAFIKKLFGGNKKMYNKLKGKYGV